MRSQRIGDSQMIDSNAPSSVAIMMANTLPFTPPRNRMPTAISAITMKAPMSGSASSSSPTTPSAIAIGSTARVKLSLTSILRTM